MSDDTFWRGYTRTAAIAAGLGFGALSWKAASGTTSWSSNPAAVALTTMLIGAIVPVTALISSWAKIRLDTQRQAHEIAQARALQSHEIAQAHSLQSHEIAQAQIKQSHDITTDYLNRALDPSFPIALRYQLLRFLSTSDKDGRQLETWALGELERLDPIVQSLSRDVEQAHSDVLKAKDANEFVVAEGKLRTALSRLGSATEEPRPPPVTPAALKAGFMLYKPLGPLDFPNTDLNGGNFQGCKIANSDFRGAKLRDTNFYQADARASSFDDADMSRADLREADLRGASMRGAKLDKVRLQKARLEGADLAGATLPSRELGACYDAKTIWPEGFDPATAACVSVD